MAAFTPDDLTSASTLMRRASKGVTERELAGFVRVLKDRFAPIRNAILPTEQQVMINFRVCDLDAMPSDTTGIDAEDEVGEALRVKVV